MDYQRIGQRIRAIRKQKNLPQERLAEAANVGISHISHTQDVLISRRLHGFRPLCHVKKKIARRFQGG